MGPLEVRTEKPEERYAFLGTKALLRKLEFSPPDRQTILARGWCGRALEGVFPASDLHRRTGEKVPGRILHAPADKPWAGQTGGREGLADRLGAGWPQCEHEHIVVPAGQGFLPGGTSGDGHLFQLEADT